MATIRDLAKKVRDDAKKNRESSENKARQERLSNATVSSNTAFTSAAKPQAELSKPAKITSDVSGEAWTRATPSQTVIPEKTVPEKTTTDNKQGFLSRLTNTVKGGLKGSLATNTDDMGALYESGQNARDRQNQEYLADYKRSLDRAKRDLEAMQADNKLHPNTWSAGDLESQGYIVEDAQRKYDAMLKVVNGNVQQKAVTASRDLSAAVQESGAKDIAKAKDGLGTAGQILVDAGASLTQMAGDAAVGVATGTSGTMLPFGLRALGGGTMQARQEGADIEDQMLYGSAIAAKEILTEKMFNIALPFSKAYGGGALDDVVQSSIGKAVDKFAKTDAGKKLLGGGLTLAASALSEGAEEFIGDWLEWQLPRIYGGDVASAGETLTNSMYDFLVGAASGLMGDASGKVASGTANGVQSQIATRRVGQAVKDATGNTQNTSLISEIQKGLAADEGSKARTLAQQAQKELDSKKTVSNKTLGNLAVENRKDLKAILENADAAVSEAARAELAATGNVSTQTMAKLRASAKVSPAASAQVQQTEEQAQVTQAENPGVDVLDAATTLFTQQGMKLKTAQEKAAIVQKLISGEEVSVRDINKLNPTSKESQAIFTQLTGVQFPEGKVTQEQLYTLYRSAHDVAAQAQTETLNMPSDVVPVADIMGQTMPVNQMSEEQILEQAKTVRETVNPEADARAAQALAQMRGEIAPDGNALLSFKEFSDFIKKQNPKATREETARLYDQYLKDNQTVEFRGQRLSHQQFMDMVRNAPRGSELTEAEAESLWAAEVDRQREVEVQRNGNKKGTDNAARNKETRKSPTAVSVKMQESVDTWKRVLRSSTTVTDLVLDDTLADNENAFIDSNGVVHLNARTITDEKALTYVLGHELVHSVRDTDARKTLVTDIIETVRGLGREQESLEEAVRRVQDRYQRHEDTLAKREGRQPGTISWDYAEEEYAADLMRSVFQSDDMIDKLVGTKPTLAQRVHQVISDMIERLTGNADAVNERKELENLRDRFAQALREDAERQNRESGKRFSVKDRSQNYTYDALVSKPDITVTPVPMRDVPTKGKRLDMSAVATEGLKNADAIFSAGRTQRYVYVPDLGANVGLPKAGAVHGLTGNKTNSGTMSTAEVTYALPEVLKNSVAVNELNSRTEADGEYSYVLFGFAEREDGKQYLVKSTVNHFSDNRAAVKSVDIYDILKGIKARKTEGQPNGLTLRQRDSELNDSGASPELIGPGSENQTLLHNGTGIAEAELIGAVPETQVGVHNGSASTISVSQLLDVVKENYPELLPDSVREHYGITEPEKAPGVLYSITEYTDEQKQEHDYTALKYFGQTYNWKETGYLTLDGKKLDFSGRHDGAPGGYRTVDHRDIKDALGLDYGGSDYSSAMVQFMSEGNIRISPEIDGINLSVVPTLAQEQALSDYISRVRGEVILDIDDTQGNTISSTEYPKGTRASKVLSDIRQYFKDGTEPYVPDTARYRYSIMDTDLSFAEQVDLVSRNKLNEVLEPGTSYQYGLTDSALYVQKEPNPMMQELGYGDYALVVTQDHIRQMLGKREDRAGNVINEHNHQLTVDQVSRIPELLRSPAAVLVAKGRPESLVFVTTETDYRGRPIIIPVKANGTNLAYDGVEGPAHVVTSMYGREDFGKFFSDAVNRGELVYYKKERIDPILTNAGYQSSGLLSGIDSDTIVGQVNPIVKNPGERKFSITQDSEGRELTQEQKDFFKDSKVLDDTGHLKVMFHGTNVNKEFNIFDTYGGKFGLFGNGSYFTDTKTVAESYTQKERGTNPRVYEVYLNITNPLDMDAAFNLSSWDVSDQELKSYIKDAKTNEEMFRQLKEYCMDQDMVKWEAEEFIRDFIQYTGGYDGITHIGGGRYGSKDGPKHRVYIAFEPEQIKNVANQTPTNSADIRYSITPEFEQWYLEGFADQKDRDRVKQEIEDLRTKYGTIPAGENPTREVNLPRKIDEKTRVHDTARTVMEAEATPEKRLADIQKAVLDGKLADVPVKNDVVSRRARARIEKNGWQTSLTDWTARVRAGETSADLVAEGAVLLNNAGNSDMSGEQYVELLTDYSNLMHRTGQSLQAARILKTLSPEGRLYGIQKTVDQLNDSNRTKAEKKKGFDPAAWAEQNEIKLDPALVDAYRNAKTDTERDFLLGQIQQNIADQMPASLSEKLNNWRYLAMLGNFRTQIRNVLGNFFFQVPREVKETVAGGIEGALEKAGVKIDRTRSVVRDSATYKAAMKDFDSVRDVILSGGKVNEKMSYLNGIDSKRRIYKNKVLEGYRRVVNTAMDSGDAVFCKFTYADSLARFMAANHTTWDAAPETLREKGRLLAIKEAAEATYRDNNAFSEMVLSMRFKNPGNNKAKKAVNAVVEGILPFRKTPANILVRGVEYSPLGLVKTAVDTVSAAKGSRNVTGSDLVNEFAKSLTGSGLFALGYFLTKMGVLMALGPDDDDKEKEFWELQGNQSYSINLFGRSYTIDWLAPEAIPLLVGANTAEIAAEDGLDLNAVTKAATRITDPMLEMSMLQGVNSLIENIANTKTVAALPSLVLNSLWSYGLQYVPTLTGQLNRSMDNTRRTTYTDATSGVPTGVQYSLGKLSQKVPGWSYNQIPYIDQWGRMEENYESKLGNAFAQFLSPAYQSIPETSDMERELQRLYDATGETGVLPSKAPKYLTVDGERRDLTAEEYVNYATLRGQTAYDMLTDLTGSAVYRKMSDKDKVKAVGEIYSYAADLAKQDLLGGETKGTTQKAVNADSYGISSAEYAALKTQTAGIESLKYKDQTDDDGNPKTIQNSRGLQTMEAVYSAYPNLTKKQYEALFEALGVGKTIRGYSKQMVQNKLNQMRKQAGQ